MKKLASVIFGVALIMAMSSILGCAGGKAPAVGPQAHAAIDSARGIGRFAIEAYLSSKGVPPAVTAGALKVLDDSVIDPALNGGKFSLVIDPVAWAPVRAKMVADGAKALTGIKSNGVVMVDQATAELFVGQLVDGIAEVVKSETTSAPATSPAPPVPTTTEPPTSTAPPSSTAPAATQT
ncbi:MAG TPA: hypothetical protein VLC46_20315 [Thermoanaerobaculia bacterium]|jgi:hypothetical protein|nr:hypothetical protein [Thermoanaerobaculia bacterium]